MADLTLAAVRDYVREYFDLERDDLPDTLIDRWTVEGWGKIVRFRPNWPGFEHTATLTTTAGFDTYPMPVKDIISVSTPERHLVALSPSQAEQRYVRDGRSDPAGTSAAYSVFAGSIRLWPAPAGVQDILIRGYRAPVNPLAAGTTADSPIDLPHPDAGEVLIAWVIYRAAVREAEMDTASTYLESFSQGLQLLAKDEVDVPAFTPIVLNSQPAFGSQLESGFPDRLRMEGIDTGWMP